MEPCWTYGFVHYEIKGSVLLEQWSLRHKPLSWWQLTTIHKLYHAQPLIFTPEYVWMLTSLVHMAHILEHCPLLLMGFFLGLIVPGGKGGRFLMFRMHMELYNVLSIQFRLRAIETLKKVGTYIYIWFTVSHCAIRSACKLFRMSSLVLEKFIWRQWNIQDFIEEAGWWAYYGQLWPWIYIMLISHDMLYS